MIKDVGFNYDSIEQTDHLVSGEADVYSIPTDSMNGVDIANIDINSDNIYIDRLNFIYDTITETVKLSGDISVFDEEELADIETILINNLQTNLL